MRPAHKAKVERARLECRSQSAAAETKMEMQMEMQMEMETETQMEQSEVRREGGEKRVSRRGSVGIEAGALGYR